MKNNLIKWIILNQHPFTIVEELYFINYTHSIHPDVEIPTADTIKFHISKFYETYKKILQNNLSNISGKISFTIDC